MFLFTLICQHAHALDVGLFESAQMSDTAHAARQGEFYFRPLEQSEYGISDRVSISSSALGWATGVPNAETEINLIDNWGWALSVTPYVSTDYELTELRSGATFIHTQQYAEDRLNTSLRIGYNGAVPVDGLVFSVDDFEVGLGLSYDIVSRAVVHRVRGGVSAGRDWEQTATWNLGYSVNASISKRARVELGVDFGQPAAFSSAAAFNDLLRDTVYGSALASNPLLPSPSASLFWAF